MDPKVFLETGQTSSKNASGSAADTSGESAKQAGRAFKEAFNAANAVGNVELEASASPGNADSKAATSAGNADAKAAISAGNADSKVAISARNADPEAATSAGNADAKAAISARNADAEAATSAVNADAKAITSTGNADAKAVISTENANPKATTPAGTVDAQVITSAGNPARKVTTAEKRYYMASTDAGNRDSRARDLTAKDLLTDKVLESSKPSGYGKFLPHTQETGNFGPSNDKLDSDLAFDSEVLVNDTKPQADLQRWVVETTEVVSRETKDVIRGAPNSQVSSSESSTVKPEIDAPNSHSSHAKSSHSLHAESISQTVESKTDRGSIVRIKSLQGSMEIALPNGPASFGEVAEFLKSQSLPSTFATQVLSRLKEDSSPASDDLPVAGQMNTATRVLEVDAVIDEGESGFSANSTFAPEQGAFNQIEKLASSTIFINQLASMIAPKFEWNSSIQQAVEIDRSEISTLIKRTLSLTDGAEIQRKVAKHQLSDEGIQIRGAVIEAISADKSVKLSDFDVNNLARLLEPKFFSAVSLREKAAVKTQPQFEAGRVAQVVGTSNFWSLNDKGDITSNKAQVDAESRFGVSPTSAGTPDLRRQIEFDSSIIAAQKLAARNPEVQSSTQSKFEILDVEAPTRQNTFTSSDALNLRNFANNRGADDALTARPLSIGPSAAPVSPESQGLPLAAPLTNSVGEQGGQNYLAANVTGYPSVSRSTNGEGFRTTQYQSGSNSVRDVVALSERFTRVFTERLVQNVKAGNYNLRFNVHPRELGAVDIAMEVRDGRLDAQISSTNPVTRDLLSESLPRLRDALQAGGLQLSNLEVNDNARDNQKRGLMSSQDHDDAVAELNDTANNLLVEDLTLDAESVDYLA